MRIILASASPRRKELLRQINLDFEVHPAGIEEPLDEALAPAEQAEQLARAKAEHVAGTHGSALIIGADTLVVHGGRVLGKPETPDQAHTMLRQLGGEGHEVISGVCLLKTGDYAQIITSTVFHETTHVLFGELDEQDIERYIDTGSPMDKAGAYGIQDDWGALFVRRINGDFYNVVGFPLYRFYRALRDLAPEVLPRPVANNSETS